jgi:hypothetical protein
MESQNGRQHYYDGGIKQYLSSKLFITINHPYKGVADFGKVWEKILGDFTDFT